MRRGPAVPIACYLAITLAVPALNGAWTQPAFWHHAAIVLAVVACFAALSRLGHRLHSPARRPATRASRNG